MNIFKEIIAPVVKNIYEDVNNSGFYYDSQ